MSTGEQISSKLFCIHFSINIFLLLCSFLLLIQSIFPLSRFYFDFGASLVVQLVKNLPAMKETQVRSLGGDDPRE